jgi:3',5'-cyclic AMP phosphodiesterase CpdA
MLPLPDAVVVTGDLAEDGTDAQYEELERLLAPLEAPLYVLAGNHDDRAAMRRRFGLPGEADEAVQYSADLGPLRLIALDTTTPGEDPGTLDRGRLDWLDAELAAAPQAPTLIALHHPPIWTGAPALDTMGLAPADRHALAAVVTRHPQVRRLVAGHMHRTMTGELGGRTVLGAPSTYAQAMLDFRSPELRLPIC